VAAIEVRGARFQTAANQDLDLGRHPPVARAGSQAAVLVAPAAQVRKAQLPAVDNLDPAARQVREARSPAVDNLDPAARQVREARFPVAANQDPEDRRLQEAQAALDAAWVQRPARRGVRGC